MIHIRQLVKDYGPIRALDHLDLNVEAGQVVGLLGPNGAGKSTALRILTGFMPPTAGGATVNGHDIFERSREARQNLGYLPESTPLYPEMRVAEQLHFFGRLHGLSSKDRRRRISELTDWCGLEQIVDRPIGHLSKGNKQRVGIAQALIHDPPVVILDEPTEGLDPSQITGVRKLISQLGQTKTVLLSTHILPEVEKTCQRVVILSQGRIVADDSPEQLKARVRSASRVLVEVKAPPDEVHRVLSRNPHVSQVNVNSEDGWSQAAVTAKQPGEDIRELLGDTVIEQRWPLREMRPEAASLEEFFVQVTSGTAPDAGLPDEPASSTPQPQEV